jgi:hypothetical protein
VRPTGFLIEFCAELLVAKSFCLGMPVTQTSTTFLKIRTGSSSFRWEAQMAMRSREEIFVNPHFPMEIPRKRRESGDSCIESADGVVPNPAATDRLQLDLRRLAAYSSCPQTIGLGGKDGGQARGVELCQFMSRL